MPRKRTKPVAAHIEAKADPVEQFSQEVATIQPMTVAEIVQQVADSTRLPSDRDVFDEAIASQKSAAAETVATTAERQPGEDEPADRWQKAVSKMGKLVAGGRDEVQGIRVDIEAEPKPGLPANRVLISFSDEKRPNANERDLLKENGFKWSGESWVARKSAANVELAYRLVNEIKKMRGEQDRGFYLGG